MLKYCLLVLFIQGATAATFDPPDINLEERLHQQYLQATGEAPPATQTSQHLVENYQLQKGENLWSLSQMLYGDGSYWPKVWAQNQNITNPHLIRQGHTLQLLLGSEDDAPAFRFSENEDAGLELTAATSNNPQSIDIPDPEIAPRPVLYLPHSFPEYQRAFAPVKDDFGGHLDDSGIRLERARLAGRFPLSGFVQDGDLNSVGRFIEPEREMALPVPMQYVYVKVKKGQGAIGKKLLIVKDFGRLHKINPQVIGAIRAHFIQVFGDVQLTELATPTFKTSSEAKLYDVYRALVLHALNVSQTDFDLVPGEVQIVDMSTEGPTSGVTAQVIGSAKSESSALYGIGDIVFIDKGSKDGVAPGQIMDLYIDRTIRNARTPVKFAGNSSGHFKVAKVSEHCATGIILSAIDSIQQGDRVQGTEVAKASIPKSSEPPPDLDVPAGNDLDQGAGAPPAGSDNLDDELKSE